MSATIEREIESQPFPIRSGVFVAVVGPSGAGKDTLLRHARAALGSDGAVLFVRRTITRPSDAASEDHDTLQKQDFDRAVLRGAFAVTWAAHGLKYGLPAEVDEAMREGRVAVANVSRSVIPALRERYRNVTVVAISVAPDILAARLAARRRETRTEIEKRLARSAEPAAADAMVIDNNGAAETAGESLVTLIRLSPSRMPPSAT